MKLICIGNTQEQLSWTNMKADVITDPDECYNAVKEWDLETNNVVWLDAADANNTYTLMVREGVC